MLFFLFVVVLFYGGAYGEVETLKETAFDGTLDAGLYKCSCGMNEALSNGTCVPSANLVPTWDYVNNQDMVVDISKFSNVNVNPVSCPEGFSKLSLEISQFVIYTNGLLSNLVLIDQLPTSDYCIDHILTEQGFTLVAEVCSSNPRVPTCCPLGYVSNMEGQCEFNASLEFYPSLVGDFPWIDFNLTEQNIVCGEGQVLKQEILTLPNLLGASLVSYPIGAQLQWNSVYNSASEYFFFDQYCINLTNTPYGFAYFAQFCVPDPKIEHLKFCENATCLRKCCPNGYIYDVLFASCIPNIQHQVSYEFLTEDGQEVPGPENVKFTYGIPFCKEFHLLPKQEDNSINLKFRTDGSLVVSQGLSYSSLDYCVDGFTYDFTSNSSINNSAIVCFKEVHLSCEWRWVIGGVLIGISCVFYLMTLIVHVAIEDLRTRMFGKCLISQVSAFLVAYITLIFLQNSDNYSGWTCNFPGTVEHIAILASFFWLNVMCFDMWSKITTVRFSHDKTPSTSKRFLSFCLYAWGGPVLIGVARVIVDHISQQNDYTWLVRSNLGKTHCFFAENYSLAKWVYLYVPILILLLINLGFFVHVAIVIVKTKAETAKLMSGGESGRTGSNFMAKKERALLYLKLFLVMGISWLLEIIMWVAVPEGDCYFWGLDIVNMLQGVFIFAIFVCKKSTLQKIKERFGGILIMVTEEYTPAEKEKFEREIQDSVA